MFNKYTEVSTKFKELEVSFKDRILCFITALFFSLVIVAGPIAVLGNLFIFNDYRKLVVIGIGLFVYLFLLLIDFFYLKGISKGLLEVKEVIKVDALIFLGVVAVLVAVVFFWGIV